MSKHSANLDHATKLRAARLFSGTGHCAFINVVLSALSGHSLADVTDVDVLAVKYDAAFNGHVIAASCKSGGGRSAAASKEVFYLRGVLEYLGGQEGFVLIEKRNVEQHHKDLAERMGITILRGDEIEEWERARMHGVEDSGYFSSEHYDSLQRDIEQDALGSGLKEYLAKDYWFHRDFRNIQNVIAHFRKLQPSFDGRSGWHRTQFIYCALHLSFSILDLCRFVQMVGVNLIEESVRSYLFGGGVNYKTRRDLYGKVSSILMRTGVLDGTSPLPALEPPYTPDLCELVLRLVSKPSSAVLIPLVLQDEMWRLAGAKGAPQDGGIVALAGQKLADDLLTFLGSAAGATWHPRIGENKVS